MVAAGPDAKSFMYCALFSGVVGFVLNLASFWCNQVRSHSQLSPRPCG